MTPLVVYNGGSGGLGRHLGGALAAAGLASQSLASRLGDSEGLVDELDALSVDPDAAVTLIQSAGMVSVRECEERPEEAHDINVTRTTDTVRTIAGWAADRNSRLRVVMVSSGHVYAAPQPGERLTESAPTDPRSVYAQTKLDAERQAALLADNAGVDLVITRVFGMIGPSQREHFLLPGLINRVSTGDLAAVPGLDYVRDYLDARDIAGHLVSLAVEPIAELDGPIVNVCSGEETKIGDLLDALLETMYAEDAVALDEARRVVGPAPGRPTDVTWSVGDPERLSQIVPGPIRSISVTATLKDAVAAS